MMSNIRYVFDTNVIVSALLFERGKPSQSLRYALQHGEVLLSVELLEELIQVFARKKFNRYLTQEERESFLDKLVEHSRLVENVQTVEVCRDPKDNHILELALSGEAESIITGDRDLLVLNPFQDIKILTPEDFLQGRV